MTTIKAYSANEIAKNLDNLLRDAGFTNLYKKAEVQVAPEVKTEWWKTVPGAKFKAAVDAAKTEAEWQKAVDMLNDPVFKTELGAAGVSDETELQNYANSKPPMAADDTKEGCPEHAEAKDGCSACADSGLAVASNFAIKHMIKLADALDRTGFSGLAEMIDETTQKIAGFVAEAKKKGGRSYSEWVTFLNQKSKKEGEKFAKTYKGALEHAKKEKKMKAEKAEEYAMRTALDGVNKKYLEEPTPVHGKGKSGPLTSKK